MSSCSVPGGDGDRAAAAPGVLRAGVVDRDCAGVARPIERAADLQRATREAIRRRGLVGEVHVEARGVLVVVRRRAAGDVSAEAAPSLPADGVLADDQLA